MRKLDRMTLVRDFDLFPLPERLLNLERKYGDSLSHEDLYGMPPNSKKKRSREEGSVANYDQSNMMSMMQSQSKTQTLTASQISGSKMQSVLTNPQKTVTIAPEATMTQTKRHERTRMKAETVCTNEQFEQSLKQRANTSPSNVFHKNMDMLKSMSHGRPPKERMNIPEGVEVFMYGNQKLNIWEFQKEQMRKQIAEDPKHFYSYGKDFLSLAFPIVNEHEQRLKEKEDSEARWKTQKGFDNLLRNENFNAHPKKPPQSVLDDLQIPYVD